MENKENRDYKNYNGQTAMIPNLSADKLEAAFIMASHFSLSRDSLSLRFDGWLNADNFDSRQPPVSFLSRSFNVQGTNLDSLKTQYADTFTAIEALALDFLGIGGDTYDIQAVDIDVSNLRINVSAAHNTYKQFVNRYIETPEEFEIVKAENAQFVGTLLMFAWRVGKTNDSFLRNLKPVE